MNLNYEEGFGFVKDEKGHFIYPLRRRPHNFNIHIGKDVEIGSGTTVHKGRWRQTAIGEGTKIDSQVHIAHNVQIGKHCIIAAKACVLGSVTIGDYCYLGGNCTIKDGVTITDHVTIGCGANVIRDITEPNTTWIGNPARKIADEQHY